MIWQFPKQSEKILRSIIQISEYDIKKVSQYKMLIEAR